MHRKPHWRCPVGCKTALPAAVAFGFMFLAATSGCKRTEYPLIEQKCGTCHSAQVVYQQNLTEERWQQVLHGMKAAGLKLSPQEEEQVMAILLENFSPSPD